MIKFSHLPIFGICTSAHCKFKKTKNIIEKLFFRSQFHFGIFATEGAKLYNNIDGQF